MENWFCAPAPVARRVRTYFAPVNRAAQEPTLFDPSQQGKFTLDSPPSPWLSLGWIQNFARKATGKTASLLTGIPASPLEQVRETLQAQVSFEFLSWTKLTMALATGSQHMNLLAPASGAALAADGAQAVPAIIPQGGSTATSILLASTDVSKFTPGSIIAVDADYSGQTGFIGTPVAGAYIRQALTDVDYIRRITFNVALVSQVSASGLTLAEPLPAGAPASGAKVQAVTGFLDREGGCFYQEWSALFVLEGSQQERIFFHYPRLQTMTGAEESVIPLIAKNQNGQSRIALKAQFTALPVTDPLDGERVVCYRSFLPAPNALV
ncbi:MAG TPA: hypothetical protein VHD85_17740 [Terracidiphilus sp.]|nr:hypothetical protein [Terracidiphilus sp.]